jgi:large subunit ribosomal protein L17
MRHNRAGVHLSRTSSHRRALFSNLIASLFTYERIQTTDAKAKETRRLAERTITLARRLGDVLTKEPENRTADESARVVHAIRMARRWVRDRGAVVKLFDEIGPRYLGRPGGYTRIIKVGARAGDAAPMSILELIPDGQRAAGGGTEKPTGKTEPAGKAGKKAAAEEPSKSAKAAPAKAKGKAAEEEGTRGAAKQRAKQATSASSKSKAKSSSPAKAKSKPESKGKSGSSSKGKKK